MIFYFGNVAKNVQKVGFVANLQQPAIAGLSIWDLRLGSVIGFYAYVGRFFYHGVK